MIELVHHSTKLVVAVIGEQLNTEAIENLSAALIPLYVWSRMSVHANEKFTA